MAMVGTHHEERVVSSTGDDSDFDSVLRVPACKAIKHVDILASVEVVDRSFTVDFKSVFTAC